METFAVVIFTVEFVVRFFTCPSKKKFLMSPLYIVDLLAIIPCERAHAKNTARPRPPPATVVPARALPTDYTDRVSLRACADYITLVIALASGVPPWAQSSEVASGTKVFRAVRLFRVFRILKLGRYSSGMQVFFGAISHSATSLFLLLFLMVICLILFSSVMYLAEAQGDMTDAECDDLPSGSCYFRTIPTTFWWAIVTMTTVGYGDAVPLTVPGKLVAGVTMISGIIVIALPISVLGNNFTKLMQQYSDESVIITQADIDGSGYVDAQEVARWLAAMRKEGKIRDERLTAEELIRRYDKGGKVRESAPPHLTPLSRATHPSHATRRALVCVLYKQVGLERKEFLRMCRETVQQGGPSNRELLAKLQRLGSQLQIIDERLKALEKAHGGGGGARRQGGGLQVESLDPGEGGGGALHNGGRDVS